MSRTSRLNAQILEEASEWFVTLRVDETDPAVRAEFDAWLSKSPEHVRAYLDMASIWADVPGVDPERTADAETLIARARAEDNIVPLSPTASQAVGEGLTTPHPNPLPEGARGQDSRSLPLPLAGEGRGEGLFRRRRLLLAASLAIAVIAGGVLWWQVIRVPSYATEVGEQRSITLADGSRVELNSRSRIQIRYSDTERAVDLLEGQGLFRVAKEKERPFVVRSDTARVRAVGTQFDVYRRSTGTTVTVLEGQVEVVDTARGANEIAPSAPIALGAGEQIIVQAGRIGQPKPANVAATTAWTQQQLVFESASLAEVAQEFNRHNRRPLVIEDMQSADLHISGVFSSADPASLLRFLREQPGFEIVETDSEIRITQRH